MSEAGGLKVRKKLIEVALPLEAINKASIREGFIYKGNPSSVHKWWAQRPLAAARAVIFAQMVDDPSAHPDLFPTEKKQQQERDRLFKIIEELVLWESTTKEDVLNKAREEIWQSWRRACADNAMHPRAKLLFDRKKLPGFHDPFAGGGSLPLEAQRLGLESHASDLNPVAVLINKAMIEIPPKFAGQSPIHPEVRADPRLFVQSWEGARGLAEDVRRYGQWMRDEAYKRVGHLYPELEITKEMVKGRPDIEKYVGQKLTIIAWLWARTVKSPNPAFLNVEVPLISTYMLSTKPGKEAYIEPVIEPGGYRFEVRVGKPKDMEKAKNGTKLSRGANFSCVMSGTPISPDYIKAEGMAGRMGARLMAIVAEGERGRVYLAPTVEQEELARQAKPEWKPEVAIPPDRRSMFTPLYGLTHFHHLFTPRQLVALTTFSDLVQEARALVKQDAVAAGFSDDGKGIDAGGKGATAYAETIALYLALTIDKVAEYGCTIVPWYAKEDRPKGLFARQAIPMVWDFAETNPLSMIGGSWTASVRIVADALLGAYAIGPCAHSRQDNAVHVEINSSSVVSTDPPYYDNIGYADLSDFFYVWLRRSLRLVFPALFATLAVPKAEELVATPYRHGSKEKAEEFFLKGMTQAMHRLAEQAHPAFPVTIYYAFKQSESEGDDGAASTGWETFLDAVIRTGFGITGTWPIRTERGARSVGLGTNALASSIVLVCRPRPENATTTTRRNFLNLLQTELPHALQYLQKGNIAPVDLAQASIGPGMAIYTRFSSVLHPDGKPVSVRDALALINQTLDEALAEQEGDFDADTRWALAWFEQMGFAEAEYGPAETLSKAKNTSIPGLAQAGILVSSRGKVRLLKPAELPADWNPQIDSRLTIWEIVHHLIRVLEAGGESEAAALVQQLGAKAEVARELAYRLYVLCERKKRAAEAQSYNALVQSFPEMNRIASQGAVSAKAPSAQTSLFGDS